MCFMPWFSRVFFLRVCWFSILDLQPTQREKAEKKISAHDSFGTGGFWASMRASTPSWPLRQRCSRWINPPAVGSSPKWWSKEGNHPQNIVNWGLRNYSSLPKLPETASFGPENRPKKSPKRTWIIFQLVLFSGVNSLDVFQGGYPGFVFFCMFFLRIGSQVPCPTLTFWNAYLWGIVLFGTFFCNQLDLRQQWQMKVVSVVSTWVLWGGSKTCWLGGFPTCCFFAFFVSMKHAQRIHGTGIFPYIWLICMVFM